MRRVRMHDGADIRPCRVNCGMRLVVLEHGAGLMDFDIVDGNAGWAQHRMRHDTPARQTATHVESRFGDTFTGQEVAGGNERFLELFVGASARNVGNLTRGHPCPPVFRWANYIQILKAVSKTGQAVSFATMYFANSSAVSCTFGSYSGAFSICSRSLRPQA